MTDSADQSRLARVFPEVATGVIAAMLVGAIVALLFGPVVSMALTGDSYQWIQHAHAAAHRPALLLADLDTFYRPSTTWTLVADRFLWGGFDARGYRTSSLVLHGIVGLMLVIAGRRLGLGGLSAFAVGLVWVTSPFTDESAFIVAYRFQPLLLLAWLMLIAVWPRRDESWSGGRLTAAALVIVAAAFAKETWVVTPALVAALEYERRKSLRAALVPVVAVGCVVAAYLALYFLAFPTSKTYLESGPHILAKIPAQLAAFLYLEEPITHGLSLTWMSLLAVVVMAALVVTCVKWRVPGYLVAGCLFVLPTLPTLLVPYMPQRYLAIPYAGFLLLVALWHEGIKDRLPRWRSVIRVVGFAVVALVVATGIALVRADLEDYRYMADAHQEVLQEAKQVAELVNRGAPVAVVRDEQTSPLLGVVESPQGLPKLVFIRNHDPYGLADVAALFEWVLADEGTRVERIAGWETACDEVEGVVLVHRDGGFVNLGATLNLAGDATRWRSSGRGVQVFRVIPLG